MADSSRHILTSYDVALSGFQNDVFTMAGLCESHLRNSLACLINRDEDLCVATIADDEEIDQLEKRVDRNGIDLLIRFQPVAADLRYIVTAMKLSGNIERIADKAVNIARKARTLNRAPLLPEVNYLVPMYRELTSMFSDALRAFTDSDLDLAIGIPPRDKILDAMNQDITEQLTVLMAQSPGRIVEYLDLIIITRHLERAGDHVKDIAEDVVYAIAAEDIRHTGAQRPGSAADLLGKGAGRPFPPGTGDTLVS